MTEDDERPEWDWIKRNRHDLDWNLINTFPTFN